MSGTTRKYQEKPYERVTGQLSFPVCPNREDYNASVVIPATWAGNVVYYRAQLSHDYTGSSHNAEEAMVEELELKVGTVVPGESIEVLGYAPNGTNGIYNVEVIGFY